MSRPAHRPLDQTARPWLMAAALATILPHLEHQALWLSSLIGLMLLWAAWLWQRNERLPNSGLLAIIVCLSCCAVYLEYQTLFGRDAGVALLVIFMAMKMLELKNRRDGMVVVTLGYFLLLTHYFYSQSIPTGLWLLIALWLVTSALIRLNSGPDAMPRSILRYAASLLAQALPFMLALYLLFPRINGPLWGLPQDAHSGKTGLSEQMTPGSIAHLALNNEIAFRVRFDAEIPPGKLLYWRGPVMEYFDGTTWRPQPNRPGSERIEVIATPLSYEITLEPHNQRWLLALDAPTGMPPETGLNGTLTATHRQIINERRQFRFASTLDYRFNVAENPNILRRNLQLPAGRNPQTLKLAGEWRATTKEPEEVVNKALTLFAEQNFVYSLQPPLLGPEGIDDFLFSSRRGFCEHYAAAFVVLMRAAGIPARVVGGYQGGEVNPVDGYLTVRQSDAHAWSEIWLEGRGWIRIDPTAAVSPARIENGRIDQPGSATLPALSQLRTAWLKNLRHRWEAINNAWNQQILSYDMQRQRQLLARLGWQEAGWQDLVILLALCCTILLGAITAWTLHQKPQPDPATRLWHKALRHLARRQVNCARWETPNALLHRVQTEHPMLAEPFGRVVNAYLDVRYGRTSNNLNLLREAIAQLP
ncbi:DUF3488 domain-containing transglutaminase family protein [Dechloromonas denitrificans]|uniref:transglutaminase TgpA family protein n=1 Tax=Dechloromonas denitrificans TaxID=281362 RepID=UPI001CF8E3CF|nr:DUF3488 and transglutaminase-like domain-containing protein [Dechloromonas denitrificans]UCV10456.1 DUF3488 domain-containing transglutaminase family protein [Dechloromonas denitrificans]